MGLFGTVYASSANESAVCHEVIKIFSLSENKKYLHSAKVFEFSGLSVPENVEGINTVMWEKTDPEEFRNKLPSEYGKLTRYLHLNDGDIKAVSKIAIDVYNRGTENLVYRVMYDHSWRNYLFDSDAVRLGFVRLFNDNASQSEPFFYKNEVFFAERRGEQLLVSQYKALAEGIPPVRILCRYDVK